MKLKLFSQTLTSKALTWYIALPADSTTTWDKLSNAFLRHFYPNIKIDGATRAITSFKNRIGENLIRGYIRFKGLIELCPQHKIPPWFVLYIFYGGLSNKNRIELYIMSGGAFMDHTVSQAWELLEKVKQARESLSTDLGDVGEFEIEYYCIKAYNKTSEVDEIAKKHNINAETVLQILHVIAE